MPEPEDMEPDIDASANACGERSTFDRCLRLVREIPNRTPGKK